MPRMLRLTEIALSLDHSEEDLHAAVRARLGLRSDEPVSVFIARRAHDARQRHQVRMVYSVDVAHPDEEALLVRLAGDPRITPAPEARYRPPDVAIAPSTQRPVVVGTGPAGLFSALVLAELGLRPIVLERGPSIRERARATFHFWKSGELDPEANVQFGEGGAGTFSDGKLYSRIKDREHRGRKVLEELVKAGADPAILVEAKPHIGTYRLVALVERLRGTIEGLGGELRFGTRLDDVEIEDGRLRALHLSNGERLECAAAVLAIGHSARETIRMLHDRGVALEAKPFSMGFRIEHPQSLIDRARFGDFAGHPRLGAADYALAEKAGDGRGVYSFCMCPGGMVVAAASEAGGVVTNGMSQHTRDAPNANSGLVVEVTPADHPGGPLAGIELQRRCEAVAYELGGGGFLAPAQLVGDFLAGRASAGAGAVAASYRPGVRWCDLSPILPPALIAAIRAVLPRFERKIRGFAMKDAVLTGVETRTSSPVRIPRDESLQSVNLRGLFPAGEGAGYAGGILSSAVDGIRVAEAVAHHFHAV